MLWIISSMDLSFGVHGRIPFEEFSNFASTGIGADMGFRYFFGISQLFGAGLETGYTYFFQKPFSDSSDKVKLKRTSQTNYIPLSLNMLMKFYIGENMYALVSLGGGGNYTILNTKYSLYLYDTTQNAWQEIAKDKSEQYKSFGYLLNFGFALRLEDFDIFTGVNIFSLKFKKVNFSTGDLEEVNVAYSNFYFGARYYMKFGI